MNTLTKFAATDSDLRLVSQFALRPVRNEREYKAATAVMERLALRGEANLDRGEKDYLDALDEFISAFDRNSWSDRPCRGTPVQRLQSLVKDSGTTPCELAEILGCGHSLVSLLLNGKRELSKDNIRALARHFKISADYFL